MKAYLRVTVVVAIVLLGAVDHPGARILLAVVLTAAAITLGMALQATPTNREDHR